MIGVNLLIFIGNKRKGPFAGFLGALGFILPGVALITIAAVFISNFTDIPVVRHAFAGIRIAVAALILDTVIKLVKGVFRETASLVVYIFVFALSVIPSGVLPAFLQKPWFLVIAAGLAGLVIYRNKKPATGEGGKGKP
jgi:chromate transporter